MLWMKGCIFVIDNNLDHSFNLIEVFKSWHSVTINSHVSWIIRRINRYRQDLFAWKCSNCSLIYRLIKWYPHLLSNTCQPSKCICNYSTQIFYFGIKYRCNIAYKSMRSQIVIISVAGKLTSLSIWNTKHLVEKY